MFVNNHTCALVLLFGTNCPYECRNNCQMFAVKTCDILLFFLRWNYLCYSLGIEPLFELSIFTAVDKVKDRILYNKVWKVNWTYWDTCQYYIIHCSIGTIWVHFKRNYNLFHQVFRSQLLPILSLTQACLSLITWTVHYLMN
jgi:hypothetical protein